MEQNKTIFNYIGQFFATFGIIIAIFIVFTCLVGEKAEEFSSLYRLGSQGLALATLAQLLALTGIISIAQVIFLTDSVLKRMNMILRYILFFCTICVGIAIFAATFRWFPINNVKAWALFVISFVMCTVISVIISKLQENAENKKMEQALAKIKSRIE